MVKVITYGTYDVLHYGHIKLLERAKELGDYLIVGVTSDDFDRSRGKINVQQPLMERVENVRKTGLADEIIIEEYEGQKIDDIKRLDVDIFTVGSDWNGKFDYLNEYCKVIYLDRTKGISSSEIRTQVSELRMGVIGDSHIIEKFRKESEFVNGLKFTSVLDGNEDDFFSSIDAVYIASHPTKHYQDVKNALEYGKHVLCESPIAMKLAEIDELFSIADTQNLVLVDGIKTAYSTAFSRLISLAKGGKIGDIVSVDATCTSLRNIDDSDSLIKEWNSICTWGPTALLPAFNLFGTNWTQMQLFCRIINPELNFDSFTRITLTYNTEVATSKVGNGVKSEGDLIISGTKGYIYVPAPWWKTDYFEVRFENQSENRRYFYQLEGEGIRLELLTFLRMVKSGSKLNPVSRDISRAIVKIIEIKDSEIVQSDEFRIHKNMVCG